VNKITKFTPNKYTQWCSFIENTKVTTLTVKNYF